MLLCCVTKRKLCPEHCKLGVTLDLQLHSHKLDLLRSGWVSHVAPHKTSFVGIDNTENSALPQLAPVLCDTAAEEHAV